jgi:hypothetical protein
MPKRKTANHSLRDAVEKGWTAKKIPFQQASLLCPETPLFQKLDIIIQTATAEDKELRYASADAFCQALEDAMGGEKKAPVSYAIQTPSQATFWRSRKYFVTAA